MVEVQSFQFDELTIASLLPICLNSATDERGYSPWSERNKRFNGSILKIKHGYIKQRFL